MSPAPSASSPPDDEQALLLHEGDRLAADLARRFDAGPEQDERLQFIGRTLALNLAKVFMQTAEDLTRRVGNPLQCVLVGEDGRAVIVLVGPDGEVQDRIPLGELQRRAFYSGARLHAGVETHLRAALQAGNENLTTRALVSCLKSKPVLDVSRPYLSRYAR